MVRCLYLFIILFSFFCACSDEGAIPKVGIAGIDTPALQDTIADTASIQGALILPYVGNSPVIFSEVNPHNFDYKDADNDDDGWVELFNNSDTTINLQGLALTDDQTQPQKWIFGNAEIPPHSFLIVFLSEKNRPDYEPPHDTLNMIGPSCWTWTDAENDIPGFSYAEPLPGQTKICYKENNERYVGAKMKFGTNEELGWTSISHFVGTGSTSHSDVLDISGANELFVSGFISKNARLSLRLAQPNIDDWKGYEIVFVGTGDSNSVYSARLPRGEPFPDLKNIYGTRMSPADDELDEIEFDIKSYFVRHSGSEPHANFKAQKEGGSLFLINSANEILDYVHYPKIPHEKSWTLGSSSKGEIIWGYGTPSPHNVEPNLIENEIAQKVESEFPPSGFYASPFTLNIPFEKNLRCALGGFEPDENSPQVTNLEIVATTVLRCRAFESGKIPSEILNRTYIFEEAPSIPAIFITTNPLSLFDPDSGIYMKGNSAQTNSPYFGANFWLEKEVPVFVELKELSGSGFSANAGLEIFGNYSRANPKKSVAITFREKYGNKRLYYPLFPEFPQFTEFKAFVLRNNGSNFYNDYIRDRLATSITQGLNIDYQLGRPAIVFYNGEYYGIHNIRERATEYYFETHYGYDPEKIDLLKADNSISNGTSVDYLTTMRWLEENTLTPENYATLNAQIDIDNFLNYMLAEIFVNNRDWPGNNLKKYRSNSPTTQWKWFMYDTDFGFDSGMNKTKNNIFEFLTDATSTDYTNSPEHTLLFRKLLETETFKNALINRLSVLLEMNFSSERVTQKINQMMAEIENEIPRDQKRWKLSANSMQNHLTRIKNFAKERPASLRLEMEEFFTLSQKVSVELSSDGNGTIAVNGLLLDTPSMQLEFYPEIPLELEAKSKGGVFSGWSDGNTDEKRIIFPSVGTQIKAFFK